MRIVVQIIGSRKRVARRVAKFNVETIFTLAPDNAWRARVRDKVSMHKAAVSLPPSAIGHGVRPLEPPVPVRVWVVRARHGWVQLDGVANAYTRLAGHVRYADEHGRTGACWTWAGAISRR